MADCLVNCINKPDRNSRNEHITHIGNTDKKWRLTREKAIQRIDNRTDTFFTRDDRGKRADIVVIRNDGGKAPYLRTIADGVLNDNLLAQRECGADCSILE